MEYQVCVFWYQVYQARLLERMLNRPVSLAMPTSILKALPGKLGIPSGGISCAPFRHFVLLEKYIVYGQGPKACN